MAVSARKLAANRRNAQRSTGPRSLVGKARSSKNATKYGLYANDLFLDGEDKEEFERYQTELLRDLSPRSVLELQLADQYIAASWRIKRIRRAEAELLREASENLLNEPNPALAMIQLIRSDDSTLEKLHYLERRLDNACSRAYTKLRTAQRYSCTTTCEFTEAVIQRNEANANDKTSSDKQLAEPHKPRPVSDDADEPDDLIGEPVARLKPLPPRVLEAMQFDKSNPDFAAASGPRDGY